MISFRFHIPVKHIVLPLFFDPPPPVMSTNSHIVFRKERIWRHKWVDDFCIPLCSTIECIYKTKILLGKTVQRPNPGSVCPLHFPIRHCPVISTCNRSHVVLYTYHVLMLLYSYPCCGTCAASRLFRRSSPYINGSRRQVSPGLLFALFMFP